MAQQPEAGPSRRQTITKLKPPPPAPPATKPTPTLPTKILQGAGTRRNTERAGYPRNAMFITRKTSLGSLLARARGIILDEGYTNLTIYALSAAIPHALLLLHALMDILPYPVGPNGMWYEITTGTVECTDEVGEVEDEEFPGLGAVEEAAPVLRERLKSSLCIELHVEPKTRPSVVEEGEEKPVEVKRKREGKKARPTAKKRRAMAAAKAAAAATRPSDDEESMMNA